jgi:DNA-directed RNA polymerase specialized sigma24 family protein
MTEHELESLPSPRLFQLCAEHSDQGEYWEEFLRRYNHILARAVYQAYRRFAPAESFSRAAAADTLQEVYIKLLNDGGYVLRRFQGQTAEQAQAYLACTAIHVTANQLRLARALKRQAELIPLQEWLWKGELELQPHLRSEIPVELLERELIEILPRIFTAPNSQRDILLLLLHLCDGLTAQELAEAGICDLKPSSIANLLNRMKIKLKKDFPK